MLSVRHAQSRARVAEKIPESGSVDQIHFRLVPLGVCEACGEGMFAGDFFVVVIGYRRAVIDLSQPVDHPRGEKES